MSKTITQLIGISPEELREELRREIRQDFRQELQEFSKLFTPKESIAWITRKEAAKMVGVSEATIDIWIKEKVLNSFKIGSRVRLKRSEIETVLINSNKRASR